MTDVYTQTEIDAVIAKGGSIRQKLTAGTERKKCSCGCGGDLSAGLYMQGWKFIRGHKLSGASFSGGTRESSKPLVNSQQTYESWLSRLRMDLANAKSDLEQAIKDRDKAGQKIKSSEAMIDRLESALRGVEELIPSRQESKQGVAR